MHFAYHHIIHLRANANKLPWLTRKLTTVTSGGCGCLGRWLCHGAIKFPRRLILAIGSQHRLMFTIGPATPMIFCINPYAILSCLRFAMLEMFFLFLARKEIGRAHV